MTDMNEHVIANLKNEVGSLATELALARKLHSDLQLQYDDLLKEKVNQQPHIDKLKYVLDKVRKRFKDIQDMSCSDDEAANCAWYILQTACAAEREINAVIGEAK